MFKVELNFDSKICGYHFYINPQIVGRETFERDDKTKHTRDQSNYLNIEND